MEKLFEKLKKLTTPTISDRGKMYFVNKKAELTTLIKTSDKITIESRVMGSYENIYYVDITYFEGNEKKEENLVYECDCLNFLENKKPCKHIIATGIAADKEIEAGNIYFKKNREFKMEEEVLDIKRKEAEEENDLFENLQKNLGIKKAISKKSIYQDIEKETIKKFKERLLELKNKIENDEISDLEKTEYKLELELSQDTPSMSTLRVKAGEKKLSYIKDLEHFVHQVARGKSYEISSKNV